MALVDLLQIAKQASRNTDVPLYSRFVNFDGETIRACNGRVFCSLDYPSDLHGAVNVYVLESILSKIENPVIDSFTIKDGNFHTNIVVEEMVFPSVVLPDRPSIEIDEVLYNTIKRALKYTKAKDDMLSYVGIRQDGVYSSDRHYRVFRDYRWKYGGPSILINSTIFKSIQIGYRIFAYEGNTYVVFDDGYFVFTMDKLSVFDEFPFNRIAELTKKTDKQEFLCNSAQVTDAVKRVSPILSGEQKDAVTISNEKKRIVVFAESTINGTSYVELDSSIDTKFTTTMSADIFKDIPFDFDIFIDPKSTDMYLHSETASLTLVGG